MLQILNTLQNLLQLLRQFNKHALKTKERKKTSNNWTKSRTKQIALNKSSSVFCETYESQISFTLKILLSFKFEVVV